VTASVQSPRASEFTDWQEPRKRMFDSLVTSRAEADRHRALEIAWSCIKAAAVRRAASTSTQIDPSMLSAVLRDFWARVEALETETGKLSEGFHEWIVRRSLGRKSEITGFFEYARAASSSDPEKNRFFLQETKGTSSVYRTLKTEASGLLDDGTACAWAILGRTLVPREESRLGMRTGQLVETAYKLGVRTIPELEKDLGRLSPCFAGTTIGHQVKATLHNMKNQPESCLAELGAALHRARRRLKLSVHTLENIPDFQVWTEMNAELFSCYLRFSGREPEALERIRRFYRELPADPVLRKAIGAPLGYVRRLETRLSRR
jgi:hypothetical protein